MLDLDKLRGMEPAYKGHLIVNGKAARWGGAWKTRLYHIWKGMRRRCQHPASTSAKYYKEKGITVCDEWDKSFFAFKEWAETNGYNDTLVIDRKDNACGYSPGNCRWVTPRENSRNRSNNRVIETPDGLMSIAAAAERYSINPSALLSRIKNGWRVSDAITIPIRKTLLQTEHGEMSLREASERYGIDRTTLSSRITSGWSVKEALNTPVVPGQKVYKRRSEAEAAKGV